MDKNVLGAGTGSALSLVGTIIQTNQILQTISMILTIIGTLITIAMALYNWYDRAKADGKISKEEVKELNDIIQDSKDKIENLKGDKKE